MVHFFSTMEHKPFHQYNLDTGVEFWFDKGNKTSSPSGVLANYLLDEESAKNATKNMTDTELFKDLAIERFDKVGQISNLRKLFDLVFVCRILQSSISSSILPSSPKSLWN